MTETESELGDQEVMTETESELGDQEVMTETESELGDQEVLSDSEENSEIKSEPDEVFVDTEMQNSIHSLSKTGESYQLPETGGSGVHGYTLGGFLFLTVPLLYRYRRR